MVDRKASHWPREIAIRQPLIRCCPARKQIRKRQQYKLLSQTHYLNRWWSGPAVRCLCSGSTECSVCSLTIILYGSLGFPGRVVKVNDRDRRGDGASFSEFMRSALWEAYGEARQVSLGGVFLVKQGQAKFRIIPQSPPSDELTLNPSF